MVRTSDLKVQNIFSVKDYVCLVTGGGTGIGLMATQALAANGTVAPASLFSTSNSDLRQVQRFISLVVAWRSWRMQPNPTIPRVGG